MLKNTVADVTDLQSVKLIEDQNIAHGKAPLGWENYLELLLSACSDYDKSHKNVRPAQRNIYATNVSYDVDYDYQHEKYSTRRWYGYYEILYRRDSYQEPW
jgi:hypothetical protein